MRVYDLEEASIVAEMNTYQWQKSQQFLISSRSEDDETFLALAILQRRRFPFLLCLFVPVRDEKASQYQKSSSVVSSKKTRRFLYIFLMGRALASDVTENPENETGTFHARA